MVKGKNQGENLFHEGFTYERDGNVPRKDGRKYWHCLAYRKTKCKARAVTKIINGYEMLKPGKCPHNHRPF